MTNTAETLTSERADLLEALQTHRDLFRVTVRGLDDEQARTRSTISELTLGGLVKHVAATEKHWAEFIGNGPPPAPDIDWANVEWSNPPPEVAAYADGFRMLEGETLAGLVADYDAVAAATDGQKSMGEHPRFVCGLTGERRSQVADESG